MTVVREFTDLECFAMFNVDMGASIIDSRIGPPTKEEMKLLGKDLWEINTVKKEKKHNENAVTVVDLKRLAKSERSERANLIRLCLQNGLSVDEAIEEIGPPDFQGWEDR